jgi:hypothetical protein
MEYTDYSYTEEDEDFFPPTTTEETMPENLGETKFKKWLNSDTDISNISSIYRLETETLNEKINENENTKKAKEYKKESEEKDNKEKNDNNEEEDSLKVEEEENDEENLSDDDFDDFEDKRKKFIFVWNEGGNDVKVTGSFSDWKIQFSMIKDPDTQSFKFELPLDNGTYQYKFIVDNVWKCSKNYPTVPDGSGNVNNILNFNENEENESDDKNEEKDKKEKKKSTKVKSPKKKMPSMVSSVKTKTRASSKMKESHKIIKKDSIYKSNYPSDDDISPLPLPNKRYFESFKLEKYSNQSSIGIKKYYDYYDRYCFSDGKSSKPIFILGHVNLNHLITVNHSQSNISKNSMSFRYREKSSTFIYYKYK